MALTKSPQELINEFWKKIVFHNTDPSVTTTLPQSIFADGFRDQIPKNPGVAENVMAGYERAVEKCNAKVEKISKACRLSNQKYSDPSFYLWDFGYCLRPLSTWVPPEKGFRGDGLVDPPQDAPRLTLLVDDKAPINLTQLIAPQSEVYNEGAEESPGAQPGSVKRVQQIFDKPEFFVDGATAGDVRQGVAGDCWFLSALSALCSMEAKELGNLVERICVKRNEAVGVYGFVFFRDGEWRSEIVDDKLYLTAGDYKDLSNTTDMDYLLKYIKEKDRAEQYRKIVQSNSDALFYARSAHKSETWVPLIEKAYAKAHGDFAAIEGGLVGDGIEDLTGGLATFFRSEDIVDLDKFWDEGLAKVNKSFLWGCSTSQVNEQDKRGIHGKHAYSILEAETIPDGTRLLKVRNPWGESEWEGDWSDRSKKWTDDLKKQLKHEDKDDGIFWISYEDLLRHYPYLHRTRMFDASWTVAQSWTNFVVPLLCSDTYEKTFKFTLSKAATTAIVLSQLDERYFRGLKGQYEFGMSFRLHKLDEEDYLYRCHHRHFADRSINLEVDLEAGEYEIRLRIVGERYSERPKIEDVVKINWKDNREKLLQTCRSYDLAHAKVAVPELQAEGTKAEAPADEESSEREAVKSNPEEHKSDLKDITSEDKPENKAEEADTDAKSEGHAKLEETEHKKSEAEAKSESPGEVTQQDQKSDTVTTFTEPEIIEKPDAKVESETEGDNSKTKTILEPKTPEPEDGAGAQSLHNQPTSDEPLTSTDTSSTKPGDSTHPPGRAEAAPDAQTSIPKPQPSPPVKKDDPPPPIKKDDPPPPIKKDDPPKPKDEDHIPDPDALPPPPVDPKEDDKPNDEPFNSVCTLGLRIYCCKAEARIELVKPSTALVRDKQFTSSKEIKLDVDDPAKS